MNYCAYMEHLDFHEIGLSFAGEQRSKVEQVCEELKKLGHDAIFYDRDNTSKIVGEELLCFLKDIYTNRCLFCVIFISEEYFFKEYTRFEALVLQNRILLDGMETGFLIPVILDKSCHEYLSFNIGRIEYTSSEETAKNIHNRILFVNNDKKHIGLIKLAEKIKSQVSSVLSIHGLNINLNENIEIIGTNRKRKINIKPEEMFGYGCIEISEQMSDDVYSMRFPQCLIFVNDSSCQLFTIYFLEKNYDYSNKKINFNELIDGVSRFLKEYDNVY